MAVYSIQLLRKFPVVLFNDDDDLYVDYVYGIAIIDKALFVLMQRKANGYCYEYGDDYFDESRVLSKKEVAELSDYLIPFDTVYDNWENYFSTIETLSLIEYYTDKQINFNNLAT